MLKPTYTLPPLPPAVDIETVPVLKALARASRALADLKGQAKTIPNQGILIDTLALQEAKASSEVENIVTTQDELFQADLFPDDPQSPAAKEVALYRDALRLGYAHLLDTGGLIPNSVLIDMFRLLKGRSDGFRVKPGTALKNEQTGQIVFVPPQDAREIIEHMTALEKFINVDDLCDLDPLIKMALIHHQFESIHPFADGNGRIGRIVNVLYLTRTGLLDIPVLYLSRFITRNKGDYYHHLQAVRDTGDWESWVVYMLDAVTETSATTSEIVAEIRQQMTEVKHRLRREMPKIYSQDLLNNLFRHPYTRIEYLQRDLSVSRQTAAKYLDALAETGFVEKHRSGKHNYFVNVALVNLFLDVSEGR
ncbi:Fic family protein [Palleronia caenipelagi]|uniref:Fic family protein n=1 Tax=Palleronia caenipelagi TaxID=2489174 RepID=A0A547PT14_9RHOB|nr:Fic/DOC family N-terminal domain-containing protein [Palleronia caenipelagi]TRD17280.1 Fic family protein [Palleronia caenipelagi]